MSSLKCCFAPNDLVFTRTHTPVLWFRFLIAQVTGDVNNSWRSVWSKHDSQCLPRKCPGSGAATRRQLQVCAEGARPGCRWDRSRFPFQPGHHSRCWPCATPSNVHCGLDSLCVVLLLLLLLFNWGWFLAALGCLWPHRWQRRGCVRVTETDSRAVL